MSVKSLAASKNVATNGPGHTFTKYRGVVKIKPGEQSHLSLGFFNDRQPARGFSLEVSPEQETQDAVVTSFSFLERGNKHELIMQAANFGSKPIAIEVWSM